MSLPRYPSYKDSGVAGIGEVPAHWSLPPLSARYDASLGKMLDEKRITGEHLTPYLRNVDVQWDRINVEELPTMDIEQHERERYTLRAGDLLVCEGGEVGRAAIWSGEMTVCGYQKALHRLRPRDRTQVPRFMFYTLRAAADRGVFLANGNPNTIPHLTGQQLGAYRFPSPPAEEQATIAAFLDRETAKIDSLATEQQRLMDLLKEKRQAVISHAVTKGLNPDAPMRDSGVEWLGDVPAHWKVVPIKWLSAVKRGASPRPIDDARYFDDDGEFAWVRIADVSSSDGRLLETTQRLSPLGSSLSVKIMPGDLFVSIAGTVGKPCISEINACIHDGFVYFPSLRTDPRWLYRVFEAGLCYGGLGKMGTQLNLNTDTIGGICIALPPADEIGQVMAQLDRRLQDLEGLSQQAQRAVDLLQERRAALISAAVTGQVDVRSLSHLQPAA